MADKREQNEYMKGLALLAWISGEILALTGLGLAAGWALHQWMGAPPLISLVLGMLGLGLAFWRIYRASKKLEKT